MAPICVSYSLKPVVIGSIVRALAIRFPAFTAEFVILAKVVTPTTCKAENLACTASIPAFIPAKLTPLAALPTSSSPLEAPDRFNFCLSFSRVDILVATPLSNCLLSNRISTTLLSIVVLIP